MTTLTDADRKAAATKVTNARAKLILKFPFMASLALRLRMQQTQRVATYAVDGTHIFYNPEIVLKETLDQAISSIAHEALHVGFLHTFRRKDRDPARWNVACDYAINHVLKEAGLPMWRDALLNPKYAGMSAEAIYPLIPPQPQLLMLAFGAGNPGTAGDDHGDDQQSGGQLPDIGGGGCVIDAPPTDQAAKDAGQAVASQADMDAQAQEWTLHMISAAKAAKSRGDLPGSLDAFVEEIKKPQIDWRTKLRHFLRSTAADDYSWRRPNVRHLGVGNYFPSLYSEKMGEMVWLRDMSGSVGMDEHAAVAAELTACMEAIRPEKVHVIGVDTVIQLHDTFTPDQYPITARQMQIRGFGGTDLSPGWVYMRKERIEPVCAVMTTDMELGVQHLGPNPGIPVLFLTTGRLAPMDGPLPYGEIVKLVL